MNFKQKGKKGQQDKPPFHHIFHTKLHCIWSLLVLQTATQIWAVSISHMAGKSYLIWIYLHSTCSWGTLEMDLRSLATTKALFTTNTSKGVHTCWSRAIDLRQQQPHCTTWCTKDAKQQALQYYIIYITYFLIIECIKPVHNVEPISNIFTCKFFIYFLHIFQW